MKNLMKLVSVFALFILVGLSACKKDEPQAATCEGGSFTVTINSAAVTDVVLYNTLLKGNDAKRMDIRATDANGRQVIITFTDLSTGSSGNGVTTDAYIPFEEVTTGTENTFLFTIIEGGNSYSFINGSLDITSCDANAKKVSGTFSFSDEDFEVTNGSFTNVCYTVLQ
ncbi:MAG: hypothetical protein ABI663_21170 [Chryseolinea sp.]